MILVNNRANGFLSKLAGVFGKARLISGSVGWFGFVIMLQIPASPMSAAQKDLQAVADWEHSDSHILDQRKITLSNLHELQIDTLKPSRAGGFSQNQFAK